MAYKVALYVSWAGLTISISHYTNFTIFAIQKKKNQ